MAHAGDVAECRLLCDADEACASAAFDDATGQCELSGVAGAPPAPSAYARRVLLVTYAEGERFERTQRLLDESLGVAEIQDHWRWSAATFREPRHARWYARHRAASFVRVFAWKPYIIWQAFRRARWGDWVLYHDASQYMREGFTLSVQPLLAWLEQQSGQNPCECIAAVRLRQTVQHEWQQRCVPEFGPVSTEPSRAFDVFCATVWRIGACARSEGVDCCSRIWKLPTHQASWSVWRKNRHSARFLHDWMTRAGDFETIAHLPFVDQSLNSLLLHRWRLELPIRALWASVLYTVAWESDVEFSALGRNDAWIFKHINRVLDALASDKDDIRSLYLLDPAAPGRTWPQHAATWSEASAPAASWFESLCLGADGGARPAFASRVYSANLLVRLLGAGDVGYHAAYWSRRWKWPTAWFPEGVPMSPGELPDTRRRGGLRAALAAQPGPLAPGEFSLGAWLLPTLWMALSKGVRAAGLQAQVVADLFLINTGRQPWPAGTRLCAAGGNATPLLQFRTRCLRPSPVEEGRACGEVPMNEVANLQLLVLAPATGGGPGARRFSSAAWALCADDGSRTFGTLFRAQVLLPA